jgi:hypothetical protein
MRAARRSTGIRVAGPARVLRRWIFSASSLLAYASSFDDKREDEGEIGASEGGREILNSLMTVSFEEDGEANTVWVIGRFSSFSHQTRLGVKKEIGALAMLLPRDFTNQGMSGC